MVQPEPADFCMVVTGDTRRTVVALHGELDLAVEDEIVRELERILAAQTRLLVADLRGLRFVDSSGIRALVLAGQRCAQADCRLVLVRGTPEVQRVLALCCIDSLFETVEAPEQAPGLSIVASAA
jgi:stage II sporulation protein AA (anti-sigma F factor antagonist)